MRIKSLINKNSKILSLISICVFMFVFGMLTASFAFETEGYTSMIFSDDGLDTTGPIFVSDGPAAVGPWYPGYSVTKTLRVSNQHDGRIMLNKLGMKIALSRDDSSMSDTSEDAKSFLDKMKIKIQYKNPLQNLIEGTVFDGNFSEFLNGTACSIPVDLNGNVDLLYTIKMDESAESNVEGIQGDVEFTVAAAEALVEQGDEEQETDDDNNNNNSGRLVEEPVDVIPDINGHWAHDCIKILLDKGIIKGYADETIKPDDYITRAETAMLIGRSLKLDENKSFLTRYYDFLPDWAKGFIIAGTNKEIFKGYPLNVFAADKKITREEIITVMMRSFYKKVEPMQDLKFSDKGLIGDWAVEHVKAGVERKIIEGYPDNTFKPSEPMTRAEAFAMICKLLGLHEGHKK